MNDRPRVHVLLVNYNGWRDTLECLESVFRLDYPDFRVIVCDNGSTDDSVERIQAWADGMQPTPSRAAALHPVRDTPLDRPIPYVLRDRTQAEQGSPADADARLVLVRLAENLGFTGGNNVGLRYLQSRRESGLVWILNNDTVLEPSSLREMVASLGENPELGATGATIFWYDEPERIQVAGGGRFSRWSGFTKVARVHSGRRPGSHRFDFISGACM